MNSFDQPIFNVEVNVKTIYCEVMEGLYLGDYVGASSKLLLDSLGVKRILMIGTQMEMAHPMDYEYYTMKLEDEKKEDIYVFFKYSYRIIDKALNDKVPIYVHCRAGISRSASLVIAFCIKKFKWTYVDALNFVSKNRRFINPNKTFEKHLIEYFLRYNTNILNIRHSKFNDKYHIHNGYRLRKTQTKVIKYFNKKKDKYKYIKVKPTLTRLEQRARDDWVVKMCRCFGNFIILNIQLEPDIRKQKLIDFAKKPSNYVDEVSKMAKKAGREGIKKRKDKIRRFLKHRVKAMIDALCGTDMNKDLLRIKYKKN